MSIPPTSRIVAQNSEARSAMPAAQAIRDQPVRVTLFFDITESIQKRRFHRLARSARCSTVPEVSA